MQPEEFAAWWQEHQAEIRGRARQFFSTDPVVDDIVQQVFVKTYQRASRLDASFARAYILRATTNTALDYLRKRFREVPYSEQRVQTETPLDLLLANERRRLANNAYAQLCTRQRQALTYRLRDEPRAASARRLGIPSSTLASRERAALNTMRHYVRTASPMR